MPDAAGSKQDHYSSSSYRKQAEALMAQIKQDMKGHKRTLSVETEMSRLNVHQDDKNISSSSRSSPESTIHSVRSAGADRNNDKTSSPDLRKASSSSGSLRGRPNSAGGRNTLRSRHHDLSDELSQISLEERPQPNLNSGGVVSEEQPPLPPPPSAHIPPSYPPAPNNRTRGNEDLNRFVSSSTAATTATSGSAASFVKHAGPAHIRTIAPQDVPSLPDRFGDMVFDRVNSRWVKNTKGTVTSNPDEPSEDPFMDIESLRDDARRGREDIGSDDLQEEDGTARQSLYSVVNEMSRIEERPEVDDEEVDLMSFSTDASSHVVSVMTGVDPNVIEDDSQTTDSEDNAELVQPEIRPLEFDSEDEDFHSVDVPKVVIAQEANLGSPKLNPPNPQPPLTTPHRSSSAPQGTPAIRPVLKGHNGTPMSALKDPSRGNYQTPLQQKGHRRSVSFSDGKRDGPIQGLHDSSDSTTSPFSLDGTDRGASLANEIVPSVRSKRIQEMMNALEDSGTLNSLPFQIAGGCSVIHTSFF